jgi:hypothetical protein
MKEFIQNELVQYERSFRDFPWDSKTAYQNWLAQTYRYVSHSTRLLVLAASRFSVGNDTLHYRFIQHAGEESRHEILASRDLEYLGYSVDSIPEYSSTSGFYQSQYYWIEHVSPISFFGYILFLEAMAVKQAGYAYQIVDKSHGPRAGNFLRVHSEEDPDHLEKAFEMLKGITQAEEKMIQANFSVSAGLYAGLLHACATDSVRLRVAKSAS